jgi:hypothetical protein
MVSGKLFNLPDNMDLEADITLHTESDFTLPQRKCSIVDWKLVIGNWQLFPGLASGSSRQRGFVSLSLKFTNQR